MTSSIILNLEDTSFTYDVNEGSFSYIDSSILPASIAGPISAQDLERWINEEDLSDLISNYKKLLAGTFKGTCELKLNIDGKEYWMRISPIYSVAQNIITGLIEDITDLKDNLLSIQKFANKKNSVLHMVSHDLRGPLEVAKTLTLSLNKENVNEEKINSVADIIGHTLSMVNNLISRELLETLEVQLVFRKVDISTKIEQYLDECRRAENALDRHFEFIAPSKPIMLAVDEAKLMQVMNNLMTNALKFTKPGDKISVSVLDRENFVLLEFKDTGIGIPETLQDGLFEKFTNSRRQGLNGEPSVGLGLSIVKLILDWHKGRVWCESKENQGTTFFIEIPKNNE